MRIQTSEDAIFAYRAVMVTGGESSRVVKPLKRVMLQAIEASMPVNGDEPACIGIEDYLSLETLVDTIPGLDDAPVQPATEVTALSTLEKLAVLRAVNQYRVATKDAATRRQAELFLAHHTNSLLGRVASMIVL